MTLGLVIEEYSIARARVPNRGPGKEAPTLTYCPDTLICLGEDSRAPGCFATSCDPELLVYTVPLSFLKRVSPRDIDHLA